MLDRTVTNDRLRALYALVLRERPRSIHVARVSMEWMLALVERRGREVDRLRTLDRVMADRDHIAELGILQAAFGDRRDTRSHATGALGAAALALVETTVPAEREFVSKTCHQRWVALSNEAQDRYGLCDEQRREWNDGLRVRPQLGGRALGRAGVSEDPQRTGFDPCRQPGAPRRRCSRRIARTTRPLARLGAGPGRRRHPTKRVAQPAVHESMTHPSMGQEEQWA
jgi:hypothetical protein